MISTRFNPSVFSLLMATTRSFKQPSALILIVALTVAVLSACSPKQSDMGVRSSRAGGVEIVKALCPEERLTGVTVYQTMKGALQQQPSLIVWQASGPIIEASGKPIVALGDDSQFEHIEVPLEGSLPKNLYVSYQTTYWSDGFYSIDPDDYSDRSWSTGFDRVADMKARQCSLFSER